MTLNYQEHIPPVGVDHIDYAIKRANLAVRRTMLKENADLRILAKKAVGSTLYLTVKRPINPYLPVEEVDEDDASQWKEIKREHKRFSVQEVLDDLFENGLTVTALTPAAVMTALDTAIPALTPDVVSVEVTGTIALVTALDAHSYIWWDKGTVKLTLAEQG